MTHPGSSRLPPNITTIAFDMDGTLWDFESAMQNALRVTLDRLRIVSPGDQTAQLTVHQMMDIRDSVASEMGEGSTRQEVIRHAAFVRTLEYVGSPNRTIADELFELYMRSRLAGAQPYPDVPDALEALRHRFRLGVISNGNNRPTDVGLNDDLFDFVVFAHDCGVPKPHPRIFEFALEISGDAAENTILVGDSLEHDVDGANRFGMFSVWLNRDNKANPTDIIPRLEIRTCEELVGLT